MSILITGGTGFIGAEVTRQLVAAGADQIHLLYHSGNFQRLGELAQRVNLARVDLADPAQVIHIVEKVRPSTIYHLGAMLTAPGEAAPQAAFQTNAVGTYHLLEAARLNQVSQFLFSSSIGTYGSNMKGEFVSDFTLQRPYTMYGITKLLGEHLGAFYKRTYGLDFRGVRYPSVVGPGVKTPSVLQYTSWVIEECAKGNPFTITVTPETAAPVMYFKDAARAIIQLGQAPLEDIKMVNYLVDGPKPTPTAAQLAELVRQRMPGAVITFQPNPQWQAMIDRVLRPIDDAQARLEWGWRPSYDLDSAIDDFLAELEGHPERYL